VPTVGLVHSDSGPESGRLIPKKHGLKKPPAVMPPAVFYPDEANRTELPSGLFQILQLSVPGATIAVSLGRLLNRGRRRVFGICAESNIA
jgi:hypothetical protein